MQIDNFEVGRALTEKLSANLPIQAYLGKALIKMYEDKGEKIDLKSLHTIEWVGYSGDEGGIMCALKKEVTSKEKFVTSITHLKIDPNHPLAPEIEAYQQNRTMRLAIQDRGGFAAELLSKRSLKPKSKKKGFGNL